MHSHHDFMIYWVLSGNNDDRQSWLVALVVYIGKSAAEDAPVCHIQADRRQHVDLECR